jgi:hypothetical protein
MRAGREANLGKVAAYNERRREEYRRATAADRSIPDPTGSSPREGAMMHALAT